MRLLADIDIPLDAGDFCLLDRRVVESIVALPERQRFLRGLRAWVGFRQTAVPYERALRFAGAPKYTLRRLARLALSGYVGFSAAPLRAATWLGFAAAGAGLLLLVWIIVAKFTDPLTPRGWASNSALLMFIGGVQLIVLGVIGEYLSRVYDEVRGRPPYIVARRVGFDATLASAAAGVEQGFRKT
jgi:dolichol-phosphate mannosyltransferase